jgi:hypothetical protein
MSEPSLTDAEPNVIQRIVNAWDCCGTCAGGILAQHVAARVAEAVDRERAAWVAKVEALADEWAGCPVGGDLWRSDAVDAVRGLLAADDTEGKP